MDPTLFTSKQPWTGVLLLLSASPSTNAGTEKENCSQACWVGLGGSSLPAIVSIASGGSREDDSLSELTLIKAVHCSLYLNRFE